jgi:hypothetical protein
MTEDTSSRTRPSEDGGDALNLKALAFLSEVEPDVDLLTTFELYLIQAFEILEEEFHFFQADQASVGKAPLPTATPQAFSDERVRERLRDVHQLLYATCLMWGVQPAFSSHRLAWKGLSTSFRELLYTLVECHTGQNADPLLVDGHRLAADRERASRATANDVAPPSRRKNKVMARGARKPPVKQRSE